MPGEERASPGVTVTGERVRRAARAAMEASLRLGSVRPGTRDDVAALTKRWLDGPVPPPAGRRAPGSE